MDELKTTNTDNPYGGTNTKDYSGETEARYAQMLQNADNETDAAVSDATSNLSQLEDAAGQRYAAMRDSAQSDYQENIALRDAIEQNNGNRQQIGHSQYGMLENSRDVQMAGINEAQSQLTRDIAREIYDLRAQGEYEKANNALAAGQAKLQQMYEDQMRRDLNLRSNYQYQLGLQREDDQNAMKQSETDKAWLRSMGEQLMSKGVMPTDDMLSAMGITSDAASSYMFGLGFYGYGYGGYGGGGGRSSGGSGGGGTGAEYEPGTTDDGGSNGASVWGTEKAYSSPIATTIYGLAKTGQINQAKELLGDSSAYFSEANGATVWENALNKYNQTMQTQNASRNAQRTTQTAAKTTTSSTSKTTASTSKTSSTTTSAATKTKSATKNKK